MGRTLPRILIELTLFQIIRKVGVADLWEISVTALADSIMMHQVSKMVLRRVEELMQAVALIRSRNNSVQMVSKSSWTSIVQATGPSKILLELQHTK